MNEVPDRGARLRVSTLNGSTDLGWGTHIDFIPLPIPNENKMAGQRYFA